MSLNDPDSVQIVDESMDDIKSFRLFVNQSPVAVVRKQHGKVRFNFMVHGPLQWAEAQLVLDGFLQMAIIADKLELEGRLEQHASKSSRARKRKK